MGCLFNHNWILGETFDVQAFSPWRRCKRCGAVQRGVYDEFREDIMWETMKERTYDRSKHDDIIRRPSSGFDQLAHSLGLWRTRKSDETTARGTQR